MGDRSLHYTETVDEWWHANLRCRVERHQTPMMGWYTGYVRTKLPPSVDYDHLLKYTDIEVHGGFTYGVDDEGWVGFDCNHAWDICVGDDGEPLTPAEWRHREPTDPHVVVWGPEGVRNECEQLAEQLVEHFEDDGRSIDSGADLDESGDAE